MMKNPGAVALYPNGVIFEQRPPRHISGPLWRLIYEDAEIRVWVRKGPLGGGVYMWISR